MVSAMFEVYSLWLASSSQTSMSSEVSAAAM